MTDKAHLLGELAALSEMAQRIERAARLHRAAGLLDTGYLTALEDMTIALGEMLKARQEPVITEATANMMPGTITYHCPSCGDQLPSHRTGCIGYKLIP